MKKWREAVTWKALGRKRLADDDDNKEYLARVMGLFDLTALGVGSTLGLGAYILAGSVAKQSAGPAVCLSFLVAAIASAFAAMCYAEFASRVPKAGSAYVYSYVTVGEFIAFVIGWNLVLEYSIGNASIASGLSNYVDNLMENAMSKTLRNAMPMHVSFLSEYPDFFAFCMVYLMTALLCVGVKESSILNNILTTVNLLTISIIIVAGALKANPGNWNIAREDIPANVTHAGDGGFLPFGYKGILTGAATCFYGFVGFDAVAATAEEAKNPQKNIPLAIVISLAIIFAAYFGVSAVLTMMWPYYGQDVKAPFPFVFRQLGWPNISIVVSIGAICALFTNLLGTMFPLPRVLYAMGSDGVIFRLFSKVHEKTKTPITGTFIAGSFAAIMTLLFNLKQLIDMMSIGTLLAYTIVAVSVLILRYQGHFASSKKIMNNGVYSPPVTPINFYKRIFNFYQNEEPSVFSSAVAKWGVLVYSAMVLAFGLLLNRLNDVHHNTLIIFYVILSVIGILILLTVIAIGRQPVQKAQLSFKVPFVPVIPCLSIFMNIYLMLQLDVFTWIRFAIWMIVGFCIYFTYGITHSTQGERNKVKKQPEKAEVENGL